MSEAGFSRGSVLDSGPDERPAAVWGHDRVSACETVRGLLAVSFAFAAGAMWPWVLTNLLPRTFRARTWRAVLGFLTGAAIMLALSA